MDFTDKIKKRIQEATQGVDNNLPSFPDADFVQLNQAGLCKPFTTRIPVSTIRAIEVVAEATGQTRSELVHEMLMDALRKILKDENLEELSEEICKEANAVIEEQCRKSLLKPSETLKEVKRRSGELRKKLI